MPILRRLIPILLILILLSMPLSGCSTAEGEDLAEASQEQPTEALPVEETEEPATEETTELTPENTGTRQTTASGEGDTWLVMLYQDGDDEVLEKDIFIDLNEAEMVGSTDNITIVSQIDRLAGGYDGDGDWDTTKRFLVLPDESGDLETLQSEELEDLGEVDMGDYNTLAEFATWAMQNYPADRYALILSDHGAGWTGGWTDNDPTPDSQMYLNNIDQALAEITEQTGVAQLDVIGFDACLMGQIDVLAAVSPYARYMVASEETEPSLGWAYSSFLGSLAEDPTMDGAGLAQAIVDSYIDQDGRITDPDALEVFAEEAFRSAKVSADQAAEAMSGDVTLTAVDLSQIENLNNALNELVMVLQDEDQSQVAEARAYAQSYTNIFGDELPPSYIDLGNFAALLVEAFPDTPTAEAANNLIAAIESAIVAEKHGPERPGSTGISVYFPDSDLFKLTANPDISVHYPTISGRFVTASLWDDFLAYHYVETAIDPDSVDTTVIEPASDASDFSEAIESSALPEDAEIVSPGAGSVQFNALTASAEEITSEDVVTLSADITGTNVGYMYIYTAYYDPDSDSFLSTDLDFISSDETKEVGGVSYPDWGDSDDLSMDVDWEPVIWTVSDGTTDAIAAAEAETYGETAETTFYRVWGTYRKAGSETSHDAYLRFDANGELSNVIIFSGSGEYTSPREITPAEGDTFTVEQEWLEFDPNPDGEYAYYDGDTVTYGEDGFSMVANQAAAGDYVVGIIVEDLDGQTYEEYVQVTVTE